MQCNAMQLADFYPGYKECGFSCHRMQPGKYFLSECFCSDHLQNCRLWFKSISGWWAGPDPNLLPQKSFDMNSINVGKTEFVKNKMWAFLGLKPKTFTVNRGQKFRLIWLHIHLGFSLEFIAAQQQHWTVRALNQWVYFNPINHKPS